MKLRIRMSVKTLGDICSEEAYNQAMVLQSRQAETLSSDLRLSLDRLTRVDRESELRNEVSRIHLERESLVAMIRVLLSIDDRLSRFEPIVAELHQIAKEATPVKEWYSVSEISGILGKAEFTVREWCRLGRVNASKRDCGRGKSQEWIVSLEELKRIQNEGLLAD